MSLRRDFRATRLGCRAPGIVAFGVAAVLAGCSGDVRSRVMHFFFEYPDVAVETPVGTSVAAMPVVPPPPSPREQLAEILAQTSRFASRHPPFVERKCQKCHIRGLSQTPRPDFMSACQECHQPLFAYHRFAHAPAAARACRLCHFLHVSEQKALLKAPQPILCTQCHPAQVDDRALATYHRGIEQARCTACHDPHFAENSLFLRPQEERQRVRNELDASAARDTVSN